MRESCCDGRPSARSLFLSLFSSSSILDSTSSFLSYQISNLTPWSGMDFVRNAAPIVDSCFEGSGFEEKEGQRAKRGGGGDEVGKKKKKD